MGGVANSVGGFLGISGGPQAPAGSFANGGLAGLNQQNSAQYGNGFQGALNAYANGTANAQQAGNQATQGILGTNDAGIAPEQQAFSNALATGATTGSKYAADQINQNSTQSGLYGQNGQLGNAENQLNTLQNQGYQLQPQDQSLYGQASDQISRNYGQQGNQLANSLASRGLSSSGAAGAQFSGLAGNQNEQLAQAQQNIMQQRFQNTMGQIGQQQNFISQLGGQYNNALQQQYGRQLSGAENQTGNLAQASQQQQGQNNAQNQYGLQQAGFNVANTPKNLGDFATAGMGQGLQSGLGGSSGGSSTSTDQNGNSIQKQTAGSGVAGLFG